MAEEFSLVGKTALLTGAARGIGRGIAEIFVEAGADIAINALTDTYLRPFVEELGARSGRKVIALPGDCASATGALGIVRAATEALGHIDILVNGVGDSFLTRFGTVADDDPGLDADIVRSIDLNLMSAIHCSRAVAAQMLERGGRIVNISGLMALQGTPGYTVYSAAKAGVIGLTRSLAKEWAARGITVNAIAPGAFPDPHVHYEGAMADMLDRARLEIPMQRFGTPREAGLLALYLASDAGRYMTGQVLSLDGGSSA